MEKEETKRLIKWILEHQEDWNLICGKPPGKMTKDEYVRLHEELMRNDFEEITLVLLTCRFDDLI